MAKVPLIIGSSSISQSLGYTPQRVFSFVCTCQYNAWSRVFRMDVGPLYASALINISHTRNSMVHGSTIFVSGGHSGRAQIAQIEGHNYSQITVGIEGDGSNNWWFCIYDNAYSDGSATQFPWTITVIPLMGTVTNTYTSYTSSSGTMRKSLVTAAGSHTNSGA